MGHVPPTPDLYFPECVSHIPPVSIHLCYEIRNGSIVSSAEFLCSSIFTDTDFDPLFRLVLPIYRHRTPIPRYDCWPLVWGKLFLFSRQV